ncbi:MAG TPA: glucosaminidase domain-containing protein [Terriglobales bacterium]|nr:glucosaminidase domain-containing protein [Terriglobales bacterium]
MTREQFLRAAAAAALASSATSGLLPGITLAQAALESNFGGSALAREANNYFGIKAVRGRDFIEMPTREIVDGKEEKVAAKFARFASMGECFAFRDALILRSSHYAEARAVATDAQQFVRALAKHWATDPAYAARILSIYRNHKLDALDAERKKAPQPAEPSESAAMS